MIFNRTITFLFWALLLPGALLAAAFVFHAGILAVCVYAFWLLLLLARFMMRLWLQPVACSRQVDRDVISAGESVNVIVKIDNNSFLPILWMYAEETLPPGMPRSGTFRRLLFIPPRRSFFLTYHLTLIRRGCHQIGPLVLESGDVFGLFRKTRIEPHIDFVTVLPNDEPIDEFQAGSQRRLGDLSLARSMFDDPSRIRGVREYQRGDAMKQIHWKCSARSGQLWSKIYDPVTEAGATLILDFHRDAWRETLTPENGLPAPEQAVQVCAAIARYLAEGGWKLGFFSNGRDPLGIPGVTMAQARAGDTLGEALRAARQRRRDDRLAPIAIRARQSSEQFPIIQENLGRIELTDGLRLEDVLFQELAHVDRHQALVVFTGGITDSFISAMLRARALGYHLLLFVVCNNAAHDRAFEGLVPAGIEVYRMDEQWRLKEIATGRRYV